MITWSPGVTLADIEKIVITKALAYFSGNKTKASEALGIASKTLYNKLKEYEEFKDDREVHPEIPEKVVDLAVPGSMPASGLYGYQSSTPLNDQIDEEYQQHPRKTLSEAVDESIARGKAEKLLQENVVVQAVAKEKNEEKRTAPNKRKSK